MRVSPRRHRFLACLFIMAFGLSGCLGSSAQQLGMTPLLLAARNGDAEKVRAAIAEGASPNQASVYGWTGLMFASWKGHEDIVDLLLNAGADPNIWSKRVAKNTQAPLPKTTALAEALMANHFPIARRLLAGGANPDPVATAIAGGLEDLSLLQLLHNSGAQLSNRGNGYYSTPMTLASQNGRFANVEWLLKQGVVPQFSALQGAIAGPHLDLVQLLVGDGKERGWLTQDNISEALAYGVTKRYWEQDVDESLKIIKYLLDQGADLSYRSDLLPLNNQTALEFLKEEQSETRTHIKKYPKQESSHVTRLKQIESLIKLLDQPVGL